MACLHQSMAATMSMSMFVSPIPAYSLHSHSISASKHLASVFFSPLSLGRVPKSGHTVKASPLRVKAQQSPDAEVEDVGTAGVAAIAGGLVANPVVTWSLYTLKTTGCGLPPGPGGALGAIEGVSYLVIVGTIGWSAYTKVKTGSGLPSGPYGLLGAVEGLSYLSLLAILVVFGLQYLDLGFIPGPVPSDMCFGTPP
ncbi:uncharacterized protein [Physcomitrium patens]|uniref:Uncharacterized protein n=1 Tax=Physcomitrium patens TaxID=3218 RepID=A0A2K1JCE1_PHYPA|nr:uncharacterized protein LOC112292004 [Physcomitrium patens]PNR39194.1 hypothetical protein PHYPA_019472 [Physcomitrium patens]|eukprot:XP_024395831.1 uncharacterized protein LOC112292004 [Physcomitrella patens]